IGDLIPTPHHIDVFLEGLPSKCASVVSVMESKIDVMDQYEVEVLLCAHELRLEMFKKNVLTDVASLNLTYASPSQPPAASTD
ncbi:hypothetical protein A2U01_0090325, partial [Trifolium medium]|nr:hypothetical protein [Trifolium medium]